MNLELSEKQKQWTQLCGLVTKIYTQRPLTATRRRGLFFLHKSQSKDIKIRNKNREKKNKQKKNKWAPSHSWLLYCPLHTAMCMKVSMTNEFCSCTQPYKVKPLEGNAEGQLTCTVARSLDNYRTISGVWTFLNSYRKAERRHVRNLKKDFRWQMYSEFVYQTARWLTSWLPC